MDILVNYATLIVVMVYCSTLQWCALLMVLVPLQTLVHVKLVILETIVNCGVVMEHFTMTQECVLLMGRVSALILVHATMDILVTNVANGIALVINAAETVLVMHPTSVGVTKDTMDETARHITVVVFCSTTQRHVL